MNIIETRDITKVFRSKTAVEDICLEIPEGVICGLLGPNGAGKTTTLRMLVGLSRPTRGSIHISGKPAGFRHKSYLRSIGYLSEIPRFYEWMNAPQYLRFVGRIFELSPADIRDRTAELLDTVGLSGVKTKIGGYSKGMKQRLGIAQSLIHRPKVLFLDEPTSGLDPINRKEILGFISTLRTSTTVVMSTNNLNDVETVCDYVAIIHRGRLITQSRLSELRQKYVSSAIALEVSDPSEPFLAALNQADFVQSVEAGENALIIYTDDLQAASSKLPALLSEHRVGLIRYEEIEPDLEQIFSSIVGAS